MPRRKRIASIVLLALAAGTAAALAATALSAGEAAKADPAVVADVRLLARELESIHPNLFHTVSKPAFRRSVDDLVARLPGLERDAVLVELMRLLALTGPRDGHLGLFPLHLAHARPLHLLPLRLWAFPDGIFVLAAPTRRDLVGTRLVAVEDVAAGDLAARVRPLVTRDNDSSLLLRLPEFMITGEVLHGLGVTESAAAARVTFERPGGGRVEATLATVPGRAYVALIPQIWAPPAPPGVATPLWLRHGHRTQWLAMLDGGRAVYAVYSHATEPTDGFAANLLRLARKPKVRRVIVDVRLNGGGDNTSYYPLVNALRQLDRPGRLVLLTGRVTFSAAGNFVAEVDAATRARIVGEPAGGSPHQYGDGTDVRLPALGWTVRVPVEFVQVLGKRDDRIAIRPDVPVQPRAADHFAGRDPVLRKAIALR